MTMNLKNIPTGGIGKRALRGLFSGLAFFAALSVADRAALAEPDAVLELFTSQGCSSCPPADRLANELSTSKDLLVLTLPVDYWDYLGWKDTLAKPEHTERQLAYSHVFGRAGVYTPQMVVNGREQVVGSDKRALEIAIKRQKNRFDGLPVPVTVAADGDILKVMVGSADGEKLLNGKMATLWLVLYDHAHNVPIKRGENRGRTVTYTNVVKHMQPIGMWKGEAKQLDLPKDKILKKADLGCAVLLQLEHAGRPGAILGAATLAKTSR